MAEQPINWQVQSTIHAPDWLMEAIERFLPGKIGQHVAQLLWQRGIQAPQQVAGFLDPNRYQPSSPFEFGQEMDWAIERLQRALANDDVVAIWGDFDADGVTSTSVLWDGLGQFFKQQKRCFITFPIA